MKGLGRAAHLRVSGCTDAQRTRRQFATDKEASKLNNNRGTSRRRGRGNNRPQSNGRSGGMDQGNRIDSRARGNATQMLEKYKKMAHDAQMNGDRVATEYYLQFADHYFRVLSETRSRFEENQQRRGGANEAFDEEGDDDADNENFADDRVDGERGQQSNERHSNGQQSNGNRRDFGGRDQGRNQARDQTEEHRNDQSRDQGRDYQRDQSARGDRRDNREAARYRPEAIGGAVNDLEPLRAGDMVDAGAAEDSATGRSRRGRVRRPAPVDAIDEVPAAIEVDRLPPALSLSVSASEDGAGEAEVKPRRRRRATPAEDVPAS